MIPCAEALLKQPGIFRKYGFADSFNPSFRFADAKVESGTVDPRRGWVATDYLGIDQGPILLQAANYRDDFVWRHMRRVPAIRRGLQARRIYRRLARLSAERNDPAQPGNAAFIEGLDRDPISEHRV